MKAGIVRSYRVVHAWVGILSGVVLFIAFYGGAFTMFKPEIGRWAEPSVTPQQTTNSPVDALTSAFLQSRPASVASAVLVLDGDDGSEGYVQYRDRQGASWRVILDGAGGLQSSAGQTGPAGAFVDQVHRHGGLPLNGAIAEPIIGIVAMLYAIALVSGVIVLLPSLVKDLLLLRITRNAKRFWLDAHNLIGITSLPFHLVMAITTAGFCLHDWVYDTQEATIHSARTAASGAIVQTPQPAPKKLPAADSSAAWVPPSALLASARERSPGFTPTQLQYRGLDGPRPQVRMAGEDWSGHMRSPRAGYIIFNPVTGKVGSGVSLLPQRQNHWDATLSGIFALHFGSFGGAPVRVAYAIMGVLGALLFYTGNLLWIESRLRKNRTVSGPLEQPRHVRWVAALTVGLSLGAVIGLPLGMVASRWQAGLGLIFPDIEIVVFNGALAVGLLTALVKGPAWAGRWLTVAAAVATLLIPATSLLAAAWPGVAIAKPYVSDYLWVDGFSLLGGILLSWAAARVRRRSQGGDLQSVWSDQADHGVRMPVP